MISLFLISFNSIVQFSVYKSCTCFVKFISEYFIIIDAIVKQNVFWIQFSYFIAIL